jgi:hypothetical protein
MERVTLPHIEPVSGREPPLRTGATGTAVGERDAVTEYRQAQAEGLIPQWEWTTATHRDLTREPS